MDDNTHYTQTPPPSEPPAYTPPAKKRSSRPLLTVVLCVIVAVLAGAASVLGYKALYPQKSSVATTSTVAVSPKSSGDTTASGLINGLKPQLKSTAVRTTPSADGNSLMVSGSDFGVNGAPNQQPAGYKFFTTPKTFSSAVVASSSAATLAADEHTALSYFVGKQLTLDTTNVADDGTLSAHLHNATTVCALSQSSYSWPQGSNQLTVNCADDASYAANAQTLKPVYDAFVAAKSSDADTGAGTLFAGSITASKTAGYHLASIETGNVFAPIGGSAALLYQTPNGTWHYLTNTQNILLCSQLSASSDLKKAYVGTTCADANGQQSKVTD